MTSFGCVFRWSYDELPRDRNLFRYVLGKNDGAMERTGNAVKFRSAFTYGHLSHRAIAARVLAGGNLDQGKSIEYVAAYQIQTNYAYLPPAQADSAQTSYGFLPKLGGFFRSNSSVMKVFRAVLTAVSSSSPNSDGFDYADKRADP